MLLTFNQVLSEENKFREAFAKADALAPDALQERNSMMIPVFENKDDFTLRELNVCLAFASSSYTFLFFTLLLFTIILFYLRLY